MGYSMIHSFNFKHEVCAVRLTITPIQLFILVIYRSPSGNFTNFLKNLDSIIGRGIQSITQQVFLTTFNRG